jgi:hypothetical protein
MRIRRRLLTAVAPLVTRKHAHDLFIIKAYLTCINGQRPFTASPWGVRAFKASGGGALEGIGPCADPYHRRCWLRPWLKVSLWWYQLFLRCVPLSEEVGGAG